MMQQESIDKTVSARPGILESLDPSLAPRNQPSLHLYTFTLPDASGVQDIVRIAAPNIRCALGVVENTVKKDAGNFKLPMGDITNVSRSRGKFSLSGIEALEYGDSILVWTPDDGEVS